MYVSDNCSLFSTSKIICLLMDTEFCNFLRGLSLFTELIPALSGMSGKSSNSSMNFTNEDGSPIDVE